MKNRELAPRKKTNREEGSGRTGGESQGGGRAKEEGEKERAKQKMQNSSELRGREQQFEKSSLF